MHRVFCRFLSVLAPFGSGGPRPARTGPGARDILLLHMNVRRPVPYRVQGERSPAFRGRIQVL